MGAALTARAWGENGRNPQFVRWRARPQGTYPLALLRCLSLTASKVKSDGSKADKLPDAVQLIAKSLPFVFL